MPTRNPNLKKASDLEIDEPSMLKVLNKYQKRERDVNERPEGNYSTMGGVSNEGGDILVEGAEEELFAMTKLTLPEYAALNNTGSNLDLLSQMEDREYELTLTPQQYYFLMSNHKFLWFCAGIASGKTFLGSRWVYLKMLDNPETLGLIGANSYDQLNQSTLKPLFEFLDSVGMPYVVNKMPPKSWGLPRKFKDYENVMVFPNGCHILLRTLDKPANLAGIEIGWFWIDETFATNPKTFDVIIARLRCKYSKHLCGRITSTPNGHDWLYKKFTSDERFYRKIHQSTRENPVLNPEFVESLETSYDAVLVKQEVDGRIISVQFGRTYYNFSEVNNVKRKYNYDPDRPLMLCWDFNSGDAPMSTVLAQEFYNSRTGMPEIQVIDEVVEKYSDSIKNTRMVIERYGMIHRGKWEIYGDAFGEKSTSRSDYQVIVDTLMNEGQIHGSKIEMYVSDGANPKQEDRVASVNVMLKNSKGNRRIFVDSSCKALINDFKNVAPGKDGSRVNKKARIDLTHPSDAFGYMIFKRYPVVRKTFKSHAVNTTLFIGGGG